MGIENMLILDAQQCFEDAIKCGKLSDVEHATNYAGNYMYTYSTADHHAFKHRDTRAYVFVDRNEG